METHARRARGRALPRLRLCRAFQARAVPYKSRRGPADAQHAQWRLTRSTTGRPTALLYVIAHAGNVSHMRSSGRVVRVVQAAVCVAVIVSCTGPDAPEEGNQEIGPAVELESSDLASVMQTLSNPNGTVSTTLALANSALDETEPDVANRFGDMMVEHLAHLLRARCSTSPSRRKTWTSRRLRLSEQHSTFRRCRTSESGPPRSDADLGSAAKSLTGLMWIAPRRERRHHQCPIRR